MSRYVCKLHCLYISPQPRSPGPGAARRAACGSANRKLRFVFPPAQLKKSHRRDLKRLKRRRGESQGAKAAAVVSGVFGMVSTLTLAQGRQGWFRGKSQKSSCLPAEAEKACCDE